MHTVNTSHCVYFVTPDFLWFQRHVCPFSHYRGYKKTATAHTHKCTYANEVRIDHAWFRMPPTFRRSEFAWAVEHIASVSFYSIYVSPTIIQSQSLVSTLDKICKCALSTRHNLLTFKRNIHVHFSVQFFIAHYFMLFMHTYTFWFFTCTFLTICF